MWRTLPACLNHADECNGRTTRCVPSSKWSVARAARRRAAPRAGMSATVVKLSASRARRLALGAQGFGVPRPSGRVDRRHVRRMLARVGLIQIDSVNVIVRSQELPLFSRLGPHRRDLLMGMVEDGELFEYWGHEASLLPIELFPLLRWRMDAAGAKAAGWTGLIILATERPDYVEAVYEEVRERGLTSASELDDPGAKSG